MRRRLAFFLLCLQTAGIPLLRKEPRKGGEIRYKAEIAPYVEFLKKQSRKPVDYVMGLFEKYDIVILCERQREGIALAKKRGEYRGRKKALSPEQVADLRQRAAAGDQKAPLAREFAISCETLYQYLRSNN